MKSKKPKTPKAPDPPLSHRFPSDRRPELDAANAELRDVLADLEARVLPLILPVGHPGRLSAPLIDLLSGLVQDLRACRAQADKELGEALEGAY